MKKLILILLMLITQSYGFFGFGSSNIDTVKNGRYSYNKDITIEEVFNKSSTFSSIEWTEKKVKNGQIVVMVKGKLTEKEKSGLQVDGDVYMIYGFEVNGSSFKLTNIYALNNGSLSRVASLKIYGSIKSSLKLLYKTVE